MLYPNNDIFVINPKYFVKLVVPRSKAFKFEQTGRYIQRFYE
jgi:hypothetical protein